MPSFSLFRRQFDSTLTKKQTRKTCLETRFGQALPCHRTEWAIRWCTFRDHKPTASWLEWCYVWCPHWEDEALSPCSLQRVAPGIRCAVVKWNRSLCKMERSSVYLPDKDVAPHCLLIAVSHSLEGLDRISAEGSLDVGYRTHYKQSDKSCLPHCASSSDPW